MVQRKKQALSELQNLSPEKQKELYKKLSGIRKTLKSANFGFQYGAGGKKVAELIKQKTSEGVKLHRLYWKLNYSIKEVANSCEIKKLGNDTWLYNPLNGFWLWLKADKDRFSVLNQNSGVYCFDVFLKILIDKIKKHKLKINMQYHDEFILIVPKHIEKEVVQLINDSIIKTNNVLTLEGVSIEIDVQTGSNYSQIH